MSGALCLLQVIIGRDLSESELASLIDTYKVWQALPATGLFILVGQLTGYMLLIRATQAMLNGDCCMSFPGLWIGKPDRAQQTSTYVHALGSS